LTVASGFSFFSSAVFCCSVTIAFASASKRARFCCFVSGWCAASSLNRVWAKQWARNDEPEKDQHEQRQIASKNINNEAWNKHTSILVSSEIELVDGSWDFQSLQENALLALQTNVFWPLDKASQITLRLNVISNSKISWSRSKKWILALRQSLLLDLVGWRSLGFSNSLGGFSLAGVGLGGLGLGTSGLRSLCTSLRLKVRYKYRMLSWNHTILQSARSHQAKVDDSNPKIVWTHPENCTCVETCRIVQEQVARIDTNLVFFTWLVAEHFVSTVFGRFTLTLSQCNISWFWFEIVRYSFDRVDFTELCHKNFSNACSQQHKHEILVSLHSIK
jgi:hypothetical protein